MKRRNSKLRNWISITWFALLMSIVTYGISIRNKDAFMIAMLIFLSGWCSAKIMVEGFEGLVGFIDDEPGDDQ